MTDRRPAAPTALPLPPGWALVVAGSLSAKPQDRSLRRDQIRSVQVITPDDVRAARFFDDRGQLGVSSFAFEPARERALYSTGDDLVEVDLETGAHVVLPVDELVDVHEMAMFDGVVWLANTGRDELVAVGRDGSVTERRGLAPFRRVTGSDAEADGTEVDRFHVNQVFASLDGSLCCLVHHIGGRQLLRRVAARLIKSQGDGGVLDLDRSCPVPLGLSGPHSCRVVGEEHWVFDSGRGEVAVFDRQWRRTATMPTVGWGRGADATPDGSTLFAGMSPIRRRYRPFAQGAQQLAAPAVEAFDVGRRVSLGHLELAHIEQVNNVYLVPNRTADLLLALG